MPKCRLSPKVGCRIMEEQVDIIYLLPKRRMSRVLRALRVLRLLRAREREALYLLRRGLEVTAGCASLGIKEQRTEA
jgi:hypothetical protein